MQFHSSKPFIIFSDSQSVIMSLSSPKHTSKILQDILLLFSKFKGSYGGISWVKAHVGISGNEMADSLAKQAASSNFQGPYINVPMSKSYIKSLVSKFILEKWQSSWNNSEKGRHTFLFLPKVSTSHVYNNFCINMFLTNRGPFPAFLHSIGKLNTPNCVCSGIGDAMHYVFHCPLTEMFHFTKPLENLEPFWFSAVIKHKASLNKLCRLIKWLLDNEIFIQSV